MRLGIMQPYFFPYVGYFSLINNVDHFILFDSPQFIRHGWIERNRIISSKGEPFYIKVPLKKKSRETRINEIEINNSLQWKEKIFAQLTVYKKAPNYFKTLEIIDQAISYEGESIVELDLQILKTVCNYLNIETKLSVWSDMDIDIQKANEPDEWALNICKELGANNYLNPQNGLNFFSKKKYNEAGIGLNFLISIPLPYEQKNNPFIPNLSIIDMLMHCTKDEVLKRINNFEIR